MQNYNKYIIPYPEIDHENFSQIIQSKKEFYDNKQINIETRDFESMCNPTDKTFRLLPYQKLLKNFMSPNTPYNGLLVFAGTGSGKTCLAVSIAEGFINVLKKNVIDSQKKYYSYTQEHRYKLIGWKHSIVLIKRNKKNLWD